MLEWLITNLAQIAVNTVSVIAQTALTELGCNLDMFYSLFPEGSVDTLDILFTILQSVAIAFIILNVMWQGFKLIGSGLGMEAEDPLQLLVKSIVAVLLVIKGQDLLDMGLNAMDIPFSQIIQVESFKFLENFNYTKLDVKFAALQIVYPYATVVDIIPTIVVSVLLIIILFNFIKLVLEFYERYTFLGIIVLSCPLGFMTSCSSATGNIFKAWVRMFIGQLFMLLLNAWSLVIFMIICSDFGGSDNNNLMYWSFAVLAIAKVLQKLDTYIQRLGIEIGTTGGSLMEGLLVAKMMTRDLMKYSGMSSKGGGILSGLAGAAGGGGGIMGNMKNAAVNLASSTMNSARQASNLFSTRVGQNTASNSPSSKIVEKLGSFVNNKVGNSAKEVANGVKQGWNKFETKSPKVASGIAAAGVFAGSFLKQNSIPGKAYSSMMANNINKSFSQMDHKSMAQTDIKHDSMVNSYMNKGGISTAERLVNSSNDISNENIAKQATKQIFGGVPAMNRYTSNDNTLVNGKVGRGCISFNDGDTEHKLYSPKSNFNASKLSSDSIVTKVKSNSGQTWTHVSKPKTKNNFKEL